MKKVMDLSFVRELTKPYYCEYTGRPSIDPEIFFRMHLIAYLYGILSDRQLCEEIQVNLAYRWFIGFLPSDEIPYHASLTQIRDKFGAEAFMDMNV